MRVLGVDPGLTRCGIGVVEGRPGRPLDLVRVGVVRTSAADPTPRRLLHVLTELTAWFDTLRPEAVAIERVFADANVSTVMGTAQVTGLVMVLAEQRELPVTFHTPTEVKAAVSGNGRADKAQVTAMVTRLLRLQEAPRPADAADALALAICHVWRGGTQSRLADAAESAHVGRSTRVPPRYAEAIARARAAQATANPAASAIATAVARRRGERT